MKGGEELDELQEGDFIEVLSKCEDFEKSFEYLVEWTKATEERREGIHKQGPTGKHRSRNTISYSSNINKDNLPTATDRGSNHQQHRVADAR